MRQVAVRIGMAAALAALGLSLGPGVAQAAGSGGWRVAYRSHSARPDPLSSVTAPSKNDAWAVGAVGQAGAAGPLILHWNGTRWRAVTVPGSAGFRPDLAESSSADNVWIFGTGRSGQAALVWNGAAWRTILLPDMSTGGPVAVVSGSDVWGVGGYCIVGSPCSTTLWHWNGAVWTSFQVAGLEQSMTVAGGHAWLLMLTSLAGPGSDPTGRPAIYQLVHGQAQSRTAPAARLSDFDGLAASPDGQLWLLGPAATAKHHPQLFHWTGRRWTHSAVPGKAPGSTWPFTVSFDPTYDGHHGIWAGPYAHWTGTRWLNTEQIAALPTSDGVGLLALAIVPGTASVWSVGSVGRSPTNSTQDGLIAVYGGLP